MNSKKNDRKNLPYRAAIIGCGRIGSEFGENSHAGAYSAAKNVQLVAVCDLDRAKLVKCQKQWGVAAGYTDFIEMLKNEKIDILSVCTFNSTHLAIIKESLKYNIKAIFCEKPIAENIIAAEQIIKLCKDKGVLLVINHKRRFYKFYQKLRQAMQSERFGRTSVVSFLYCRGIANSGSHIFDLLNFLFGEPEWVSATYSTALAPDKNDPNINGVVKYKNDVIASVLACDDKNYYVFELDILADKARIKIGQDFEYYHLVSGGALGKKELVRSNNWPLKDKPGPLFILPGVEHLIACLEGREKPVSSGADGRSSLELISAFHLSARKNGQKVLLPLKQKNYIVRSK